MGKRDDHIHEASRSYSNKTVEKKEQNLLSNFECHSSFISHNRNISFNSVFTAAEQQTGLVSYS